MNIERAVVISVGNGGVHVRLLGRDGCGCSGTSGCASATRSVHLAIGATHPSLRPRDLVEVGLPAESRLRRAMLGYVLPFAGIVSGAICGAALTAPGGTELYSIGAAAAGFICALGASRVLARQLPPAYPAAVLFRVLPQSAVPA